MIQEQDLGQSNVDWVDRTKALAEFGITRPDQKGDQSGHPFHGNRYTGGIGGALPPARVMSEDQRASLMDYQGNMADDINDYLRHPETNPVTGNAFVEKHIADIHKVMQPLARPTTSYRGIASLGVEAMIGHETGSFGEKIDEKDLHDRLAALAGTVIEDKGFCSTSYDRDVAAGKINHFGVVCEIDIPAGQSGFDRLPDPAFRYEKELLLDHGTKFRVDGVSEKPVESMATEFPTYVLKLSVVR